MDKWQQKLSIGYFFIALVLLFLLQTYLASPQVGTISYSQFKALVKSALLANLNIGEKAIHGEIKPEGAKQALPPERLKVWEGKLKDSKQGVPFVTIRVEDPELVTDLERAGSNFKGEVINEWLPTVLSWVVPVVLFVLLWNFLFKRMAPQRRYDADREE